MDRDRRGLDINSQFCYNTYMTERNEMHNIFITSDLHFGHANILKYNPDTRKYRDVNHMNTEMIREWNSSVTDEDLVYILGDVAFCNVNDAVAIMRQLRGQKILIAGNHDTKLIQHAKFRECFLEIHQYHTLSFEGKRICMFHYPIFDHDQAHRGSIMLHGHRHGKPHGIPGRIMDVGMDATGKVVSSLSDIVQKMILVEPMKHHDRDM